MEGYHVRGARDPSVFLTGLQELMRKVEDLAAQAMRTPGNKILSVGGSADSWKCIRLFDVYASHARHLL
eukprot:8956980-Prorocentrum_lima.AAC.1